MRTLLLAGAALALFAASMAAANAADIYAPAPEYGAAPPPPPIYGAAPPPPVAYGPPVQAVSRGERWGIVVQKVGNGVSMEKKNEASR